MSEPAHRSGVVALLGRPNAGKSTLLNRLLGEKLAIVTAKPQTTRSRILGIWSDPRAQILFLDTPGFHSGAKALNKVLNDVVDDVAEDCDVAMLLIDPERGWDAEHRAMADRVRDRGKPVLAVATKCDRPGAAGSPWPPQEAGALAAAVRTSARTGEGLEELIETVLALLPEGPSYYPDEDLTDRPLRFLAAELIREAAFELLEQEVPYSLAVSVVEFDESRPDLARIRAELLVERTSQKGIVLGRGGAMIKRIGIAARRRIESLLGQRVHLELFVKCDPKWTKRPKQLKSLGYH